MIRHEHMRNQLRTGYIVLFLALTFVAACTRRDQTMRSDRREDLSLRNTIVLCPEKPRLDEADLEKIAADYGVKLHDILKLNESCRPQRDATTIDLTSGECHAGVSQACPKGALRIPLR